MLRMTLAVAAILAATASDPAPAVAEGGPHVVLELFTSQGCSSCPAADAFVGDLAAHEDVLALTMPVRLWDFLGWADTLASDVLTKRQIAYSVARGDRDVFTPQLMANGEVSMLGSDRPGVLELVRQHDKPLPVPLSLSLAGDVLTISAGKSDLEAGNATLWLLLIDREARVPIGDGENRGRRLTYFNVVREMRPIGMWKGRPMSFDLPLADVERGPGRGCAVIAQLETFKGPGRIVGAARIAELSPARTVGAKD